MIDRISGVSCTIATAFAGRGDDHSADQAGPAAAAIAEIRAKPFRVLHRLSDDAVEQVDMGACRDLRHHAAETGVLVVCERTISDRILPLLLLWRSTTAAAVSSQVVSIPSTSIGVSLSNLIPYSIPCAIATLP